MPSFTRTPIRSHSRVPTLPMAALAVAILASALAPRQAMAEESMVWRENFDNNARQWATAENDEARTELSGGVFRMVGKKTGARLWTKALQIDRSRDHRIRAVLRHEGSGNQGGYGLVWDYRDGDNYYAFLLTPQQGFSILRVKAGVTSFLAPWTPHKAILGGTAYNTAIVSRTGKTLGFEVNGTIVKSLPFETFSGGSAGFMILSAETMAVDSLTAYAAQDYSGPLAVDGAETDILFQTAFGRDSSPWLTASTSIPGSWDESDPSRKGYTLVHGNSESLAYVVRDFGFDPSGDFLIEASIGKLSGDDNLGYGLILNRVGRNFLYFFVAGTGHFTITRYVSGLRQDVVKWTQSPNVNTLDSSNRLGVHRMGPILQFSLNGRVVHEEPYQTWTSTQVGIGTDGTMRLRPESLAIKRPKMTKGALVGRCIEGFGVFAYDDGARHAGSWRDGKPNGYGTRYSADGTASEGWWVDGTLAPDKAPREPVFYPVVKANGDNGLVDSAGENPSFGLGGLVRIDTPVRGRQFYVEDKRPGFLDANGDLVNSPFWSLAGGFSEGIAVIRDVSGESGLVDDSGEVLVWPGSYRFEPNSPLSMGTIVYRDRTSSQFQSGIMGRNGMAVLPAGLGAIQPFAGGFARAQETPGGPIGFIDRSGAWRIKPSYQKAGDFSEGLAYFENGSRNGFIDSSGREAISVPQAIMSIRSPQQFKEGLVPFGDAAQRVGYLDMQGEVAIPPLWDIGRSFSEGLAAVGAGGKWGYIDNRGTVVIPMTLESADSFVEGLAPAKSGGKWGYIDRGGEWVIQPTYSGAFPFKPEGLAQVRAPQGYWTWIDRTGKEIWSEPAE